MTPHGKNSKNQAKMIDGKRITKMLEKLGFTEKEAQVYMILLELNEALPSTIARKSNLKRPTVYSILEKLQKKGFASHIKRDRLVYFRSISPHFFLEKEDAHVKDMSSALSDLKASLPDLLSLHQKYAATPQMSVFTGRAGLIQIMEDTLTTKTELLCWANTELAFNSLKDYYPTYIQKKVQKKLWLRGIFCKDPLGEVFKSKGKEELREVYLISKEDYPFNNEINIYDDKVAIISHEDQIGVIIQNQNIADAQRAIFNFAFKYAKLQDVP